MIDTSEEPLPFTTDTKESKGQKRNVFKENWLKVDETCEKCGQVTKKQRGLTKQNLKRLITPRWNIQEIVITVMIIMMVILTYAYKAETQQSRDWLTKMYAGSESACNMVCSSQCRILAEAQARTTRYNNNSLNSLNNLTIVRVNERMNNT